MLKDWVIPPVLCCSALACTPPLLTAGEHDRPPNRGQMIARIDELIAAGWAAAKVTPAAPADDAEFLRRVSLDIAGVPPRVGEARAFLASSDPEKRMQLIERLVRSPECAAHLANTWRNIMLPGGFDPERSEGIIGLHDWLRQQFAAGARYDHIVADLLVATEGNRSGPALFYTALQLKPEELATSTARMFLGLQIGCAQCHDHPFAHWKQRDFWGYAAFFARVKQADMRGARFRLIDAQEGEVMIPGKSEAIAPIYPDGQTAGDSPGDSRRRQLAVWVVSRDNPFVARAAVNWAWSHLFGRGLVEPIDDLGPHNPPSHPELFNELSSYFISAGFDLRELLCTIAGTRTYQLSSTHESTSPSAALFARMPLKVLTADQLYDSLRRASLGDKQLEMSPLADPERQAFLARLEAPGRNPSEFQAGAPQALRLMHGAEMRRMAGVDQSSLLKAVDNGMFNLDEQIDVLTLATLSRMPDSAEREQLATSLRGKTPAETRQAMSNVLWALLNSAEFAINH